VLSLSENNSIVIIISYVNERM